MPPKTSTCIVALKDKGNIWIGGDSAATSELQLTERADPKVFIKEDPQGTKWIFGFSGDYRMGQLMQYTLELPEMKKGEKDVMRFLVTQFIPSLGTCLNQYPWEEKKKDAIFTGSFIVGVSGRIFTVYNDYQIEERAGEYTALGCGEQVALGSLYTSEEKSPKDRIRIALEAAAKFNTDVEKPFIILNI